MKKVIKNNVRNELTNKLLNLYDFMESGPDNVRRITSAEICKKFHIYHGYMSVLVKGGIINKVRHGVYQWVGPRPSRAMVDEMYKQVYKKRSTYIEDVEKKEDEPQPTTVEDEAQIAYMQSLISYKREGNYITIDFHESLSSMFIPELFKYIITPEKCY